MTDTQKQICHSICKHYGIESQRRQLVEECAALHDNGQPMKAKTEDYQPFKNGGEKNDRF